MAYSLTYLMTTGQGVRRSETAGDVVFDHRCLLAAGGSGIVIRDELSHVVSLASLAAAEPTDRNPVGKRQIC